MTAYKYTNAPNPPGTPQQAPQVIVLNPVGQSLMISHVPPIATGLSSGGGVNAVQTGNLIAICKLGDTPGANGIVLSQANATDLGTVLTNFGTNGILS